MHAGAVGDVAVVVVAVGHEVLAGLLHGDAAGSGGGAAVGCATGSAGTLVALVAWAAMAWGQVETGVLRTPEPPRVLHFLPPQLMNSKSYHITQHTKKAEPRVPVKVFHNHSALRT